jgi:hypothetical protein
MARSDSACALFFVRDLVGQPTDKIGIFDGLPSAERGLGQMAKRWYSVSVLSNFEKKIAEQIKMPWPSGP